MDDAKRRNKGAGSVFERKDGKWVAQIETGFTRSGARRKRTRVANTRAEASKALKALQREAAQGVVTTSRATVKTWADTWLTMHEKKVRPSTYATDKGAVDKWIVPTIGRRRLCDLTPADVRAVAKAATDAGRSETTARHAQGKLVQMLKAAMVEGHQVPPRCLLVDAPSLAVNDREAVMRSDVMRLLKAAADGPDFARWVVALVGGMRQAEVLGLTWDAIDWAAGTIDVRWQLQSLPYVDKRDHSRGFRLPPGAKVRHLVDGYHLTPPKTKSGFRILPMPPLVRAALEAWREVAPDNPWGLVFVAMDSRYGEPRPRPVSDAIDRQAWRDLQATAGVSHPSGRPYHVHEARHAAATMLLEQGADPKVVESIMGHSSILTSRGYQHVSTSLARAALEGVAERLELDD